MSQTKDFDAMLAATANQRPTFKIGGQEFTLRAKLPYAKWNKLLHSMRSDDVDANEATGEFFNTVLIRSDRARFQELLNKDEDDDESEEDNVIDLVQMDQLTDWVMEHFTGKARRSTDGSSPGVSDSGQPPNVVSLSSRTGNA